VSIVVYKQSKGIVVITFFVCNFDLLDSVENLMKIKLFWKKILLY